MDISVAIEKLEAEWDQVLGTGFFVKLYNLEVFDDAGFEKVKAILDAVQMPDGDMIDKRFVEVIWFIPTFLRWQQDSWRTDGKDTTQLDRAIASFEQRLTSILGLP